tara:strand:- start:208 stop:366 length:159 start_codon:yes stop_codon:yes gene_type:complete
VGAFDEISELRLVINAERCRHAANIEIVGYLRDERAKRAFTRYQHRDKTIKL